MTLEQLSHSQQSCSIGSTGQGVGHATARKITHRKDKTLKLAQHHPDLKPYIEPALKVLTRTFANNGRVLLEGTQGTGQYSSRNLSACDLKRYYCIRLPSRRRHSSVACAAHSNGLPDLPHSSREPRGRLVRSHVTGNYTRRGEQTRSGIDLEELRKIEKRSITNRKRRIGEFDWELIRQAAFLNRPTDIALSFADYFISKENRLAKCFEQLTQETINMIEVVEHVTRAKVSLIGTGFNSRSIIDRHDW